MVLELPALLIIHFLQPATSNSKAIPTPKTTNQAVAARSRGLGASGFWFTLMAVQGKKLQVYGSQRVKVTGQYKAVQTC